EKPHRSANSSTFIGPVVVVPVDSECVKPIRRIRSNACGKAAAGQILIFMNPGTLHRKGMLVSNVLILCVESKISKMIGWSSSYGPNKSVAHQSVSSEFEGMSVTLARKGDPPVRKGSVHLHAQRVVPGAKRKCYAVFRGAIDRYRCID